MGELERIEHASARLLYDDAAPRLRRPVNPTVLKLRRPGWLTFPVSLALSAVLPALGLAWVVNRFLPIAAVPAAGVLAGVLFVLLLLGLLLASREEKSFALVLPTTLSVAHALLGVGFGIAFALIGPEPGPAAAKFLASLPGPDLDTPLLQLGLAYCILFAVLTTGAAAASLLFRIVGLRRVPAEPGGPV